MTDARFNTTSTDLTGIASAVMKITHPGDDSTMEFTYSDPNNPFYMAGRKDENGSWTYYERDGSHRVTKITYPDQSTEEFTYNDFEQVLTHKLQTGGWENFRYDSRGRQTEYWPPPTESDPNPSDHKTQYFYYDNGPNADRLLRVQDPRGNSTWYEYNQRGQVTKLTHQDGTYILSGYNDDGTLAWTADENHPGAATDPNQRTRYTYDEYKRVLTVTNPMGQTTTNSYALDPDWAGPSAKPLLHTTNTVKYTLSPMNKNVVYAYDENLRRTHQAVAMGTADEAWTLFWYDEVGNLTTTQDPRGHQTHFGYDQRNRKIWLDDPIASDRNSTGHTMNWVYDGVGNKLKETRADNAFRSWDYDSVNRLWHAYEWRTNDPPDARQTTTYTQNVTGNTRWITDTKGTTYTFTYDALARKISETYPPTAGNGNPVERFWYDAAGNLVEYQDPATHLKHLRYDERNRQRHTWWDGAVGPDVVTNLDAASRMTDITTNNGETVVAFGYDNANRLLWEDQTVAGQPTHRVQHDRDADGNAINTHIPGWCLNWYVYNQRNQLAQIQDGAGTPWINFSYDSAGNMTKRQTLYGGVNDSLNVTSGWYDGLNRPQGWENTGSGDTMFARSWQQYDSAGRMTATWRDEQGGKGDRFYYATTNQLTNVRYNADQVWTGNPVYWDRWVDYGYQPGMLNRWYLNDNGNFSWVSAGHLNEYTSIGGQALEYGGNFNLRSYAGASFTYIAENQLVSGTRGTNTVQFVYDGLGRCLKRTTNGASIIFAYDGWKPVAEWAADGSYWGYRIYGAGPDELLWSYDSRIGNMRVHSDTHGNVIALLDWYGNGIEKYTYDAFGTPKITDWAGNVRTTSVALNRFMFQGREWIAELGIYDYRHRMYLPSIGRFLQTDPTGFDAGDMNLFRYCGDDPVDRSDPTGLVSVLASLWNYAKWMQSGSTLSSRENDLLQQGQAKFAEPAGNYKKPLEKHVARNGETGDKPGLTTYSVSDIKEVNGILVISPTLDWWVKGDFIHTSVVTRELEHVSRWLWWQAKGGDGLAAVQRFNRSPKGIDYLQKRMENVRLEEKGWQESEIHKNNRHVLKFNPAVDMNPAELEQRIQSVKPEEYPQYRN